MAVKQVSGVEVSALGWMEGSWECEKWGGVFEEVWIHPGGGILMGVGRHIVDGKAGFMEFLSIEPSDAGLTMWILLGSASQGLKSGVPFVLTSWDGRTAVFENPSNAFPSVISYERGDEGMMCRISGVRDGKPLSEDFEFRPLVRSA